MRKLLLIAGLLSSFLIKAQVSVYLSAGVNNTQVHATGSPNGIPDGDNSKWQWQSAATLLFPIAPAGFLYTGIVYEAKAFHERMDICCVVSRDVEYSPKYVAVPVGLGYRLPVLKRASLQFSIGGYASMGVGGQMEGRVQRNDLPISGGLYMNPYFSRKINFGGTDADLKKWRWALESRVSAGWHKWRLQFHYQMDMSSSERNNSYREFSYRTTGFDLAYQLFSFKK